MEARTRLINQLTALADALANSKQEVLDMGYWNRVSPDENGCGYAACVVGELALHGDLSHFNTERSAFLMAHKLNSELNESSFLYQEWVGIDLLNMKGSYITESITSGTSEDRIEEYNHISPCILKDLSDHPHLIKDNPTPAEARDFILQIIDNLQ